MPEIVYRPFKDKYPQVRVFVGGCHERGDGSSFRAMAHGHYSKPWICVRSMRRIYETPKGGANNLMLHELAHVLTKHGHDDVWRAKMKEIGGRVEAHYKKKPRRA